MSKCPQCGNSNDAATSVEAPDATPSAGDVAVCFSCGALGYFTGDGFDVRLATPAERAELLANPDVADVVIELNAFQTESNP